MIAFETARLRLRELASEDAAFILELVNEPAWLQFIGDKGVRTLDDARKYIAEGPVASYRANGFGLWLVELQDSPAPIGICGLIRRPTLEDVDLGFALLANHHGRGFAREAAAAVVEFGRTSVGLKRLVAITLSENVRSIRVLETVGFGFERRVKLSAEGEELALYSLEL